MKKFFLKNGAIKLTSLLLALFLWAVVNGQREEIRQISVPLLLPELPDSLMVVHHPGDLVVVTFRAPAARLFWFRVFPPKLEPVFEMRATGSPQAIALIDDFLDLPRQFQGSVLSFSPAIISLQISEVGEMEIPVSVVMGRGPDPPWEMAGEPVAEPVRILARGPVDRIGFLRGRRARTEPLSLQGREGLVRLDATLESPDPLITLIPDKVSVEVQLVRPPEEIEPAPGDLDLDGGAS